MKALVAIIAPLSVQGVMEVPGFNKQRVLCGRGPLLCLHGAAQVPSIRSPVFTYKLLTAQEALGQVLFLLFYCICQVHSSPFSLYKAGPFFMPVFLELHRKIPR